MSFKEIEVEICADLANHGFGIFDTSDPTLRTIFYGEMPEGVTEGLLVVPIPSPPPHQYVDTEYPVLDFWAKSPHTDRANALLRNVYNTYHRRYGYALGDWNVYFSQALGTIVDVDRDREGGKLMRLSIQFLTRNLTNVS